MKLTDFKLRAPRGTYYGVRPTPETVTAMQQFMGDHKIPNRIEPEKMHCTIVFSRVFCNEQALGFLDPHWKGKFEKYDLFNPAQDQTDEKCLVLGFICPEMIDRHNHLKTKGATHDFPNLSPHMTLSYKVDPDYDHLSLPKYDGPIHFHHEYSEPLNLNYVKTKINK